MFYVVYFYVIFFVKGFFKRKDDKYLVNVGFNLVYFVGMLGLNLWRDVVKYLNVLCFSLFGYL